MGWNYLETKYSVKAVAYPADLTSCVEIEQLIELNITALVKLTYLFGNDMKKLYYASKSFVLSFSEALAAEPDGTGISVTALCPGPTSTGFEKMLIWGSLLCSRDLRLLRQRE